MDKKKPQKTKDSTAIGIKKSEIHSKSMIMILSHQATLKVEHCIRLSIGKLIFLYLEFCINQDYYDFEFTEWVSMKYNKKSK